MNSSKTQKKPLVKTTVSRSVSITKKEEEILIDIFSKTPLSVFNSCVENYNLQRIHSRQQNHLVTTYFNGNTLKFSVAMSKLFNKFLTSKQELKSKELSDKLYFLAKSIRSKKKYKQPHSDLVKEYNEMVLQHNELNKNFTEFRNLYKKYKPKTK